MSLQNKKELGQNWLKDRNILAAIADEAELSAEDTVLEIGPGLGTLTSELLRRSGKVVAVEYDSELAKKLPGQFPGKNLQIINEDILQFNLSSLPTGYKVVANVPYYITSKIIDKLVTSDNKPSLAVILVQKEVAERIVAKSGSMSLLALNTQIYAECDLGIEVSREYFTPPPKVDSQLVILRMRDNPLIQKGDLPAFWRVAKAGFANKRKKIRSSLSAGLSIDKTDAEMIIKKAGIDPNKRADDLSIEDWLKLSKSFI